MSGFLLRPFFQVVLHPLMKFQSESQPSSVVYFVLLCVSLWVCLWVTFVWCSMEKLCVMEDELGCLKVVRESLWWNYRVKFGRSVRWSAGGWVSMNVWDWWCELGVTNWQKIVCGNWKLMGSVVEICARRDEYDGRWNKLLNICKRWSNHRFGLIYWKLYMLIWLLCMHNANVGQVAVYNLEDFNWWI